MSHTRTLCTLSSLLAAIAIEAMSCAVAFAAPPVVVSTAPENGDDNVEPTLNLIRIEFNQEMNAGGRSICGGGPAFPKINGNPTWESPRVFLLPVALEPDHEYSFSVNCPAARNFRGVSGESADNYPVTFRTRAAGAAARPPLTPAQNEKATEALRRAVRERYSYRDLRKVDWDAQFRAHADALRNTTTPWGYAREAARLLAPARDVHVHLRAGVGIFGTHSVDRAPNINPALLDRLVPNLRRVNDCVIVGRFDDGIGYILLPTWSGDCASHIEAAVAALRDFRGAPGLIVDVRNNGGGDETLAQRFAGCFVDKPVVYSRNDYRKGEDEFGEVFDRVLQPTGDDHRFTAPVAVLMGPTNMSSNESFLLMMKQASRVTLVGQRSYGSSGNPKPHDLGNGVTVFLPSWRDLLPDGTLLEGRGVEPDVTVKAGPDAFRDSDPVLEEALKVLRK